MKIILGLLNATIISGMLLTSTALACSECGGNVKIIASIEDPVVIRKILAHLDQNVSLQQVTCLPESRAPPATGLFV